MLRQFRQRVADYLAAINLDAVLLCRGQRRRTERLALFREHRDLFTPDVIAGLRQSAEESDGTAGVGVRRLLALATDGYTFSAALTVDEEIDRQLGDPRVRLEPGLLDDLFAERERQMAGAAIRLGYRDLLQLRTEIHGIDYAGLAMIAERLLERTAAIARRGLAAIPGREGAGSAATGYIGSRPDLQRWWRSPAAAPQLSASTRPARYADFLTTLGLHAGPPASLRLIEFSRPDLPGLTDRHPATNVWPVNAPPASALEEIHCGWRPLDGRAAEHDFWQTVGAGQSLAWTSPNLPIEFRRELPAGDQAGRFAWGMLFGHLLLEPRWLTGPFAYSDTRPFRSDLATRRLLELRLAAARLIYEVEALGGTQVAGSSSRPARYDELLTLALGVGGERDDYRRARGHLAGPGQISIDTAGQYFPTLFGAADLLRAAVFESQFREYLKSRTSAEWWTNRKACDILIDTWNTGQRYRVEELGPLIGFGPLDFDWLIEELWRENDE